MNTKKIKLENQQQHFQQFEDIIVQKEYSQSENPLIPINNEHLNIQHKVSHFVVGKEVSTISKEITPARIYPFTLDPFQQQAIEAIRINESVLVAAHTSAGKTGYYFNISCC